MTEEMKSPGARRGEILAAEMRRATLTNNGAATCMAYVETAKQLLAEYPDMSPSEKQLHHGVLIKAIEDHKVRTNHDCSNVRGELARLLGPLSRAV